MLWQVLVWCLSALALVSCGGTQPAGSSGPAIVVSDVWARPAAMAGDGHGGMGMTSAVYFVVRNRGSEADRLVGAATEVAGRVELHETRREGDTVRMVPVGAVEVPAGGEVQFRPGGLHVMLMELKRDLKAGDSFELRLRFERAGEVVLSVPVRAGQDGM